MLSNTYLLLSYLIGNCYCTQYMYNLQFHHPEKTLAKRVFDNFDTYLKQGIQKMKSDETFRSLYQLNSTANHAHPAILSWPVWLCPPKPLA